MVRPFRYGDIFLVQRLSRQATKLNIVQATLHRQSAVGSSLSSILPWNHGKVTTYILRQSGHRLATAGFLQVQRRPGRPELDVVHLSPGLDARRGHPAIWEKLLSFQTYEAAKHKIERVYADVPDQPLPVNTFTQTGYRTYTRQSIWRMTPAGTEDFSRHSTYDFRSQTAQDEWALAELYRRNVPQPVQMAEGMLNGDAVHPPILSWWQGGSSCSYVLTENGEVRGSIQIARGNRGNWIQPWYDFTDPDTETVHELIRFALTALHRWSSRLRVYAAVREYHGSMGSALEEYNFAPVTDRAKMVKHVHQWLREAAHAPHAAMETAPSIAAVPFDMNASGHRHYDKHVVR